MQAKHTWIALVMAAILAGLPPLDAQETPTMTEVNVLVNGSFEETGQDGLAAGWHLSGAGVHATSDRRTTRSGKASQQLTAPTGGRARFWQDVTVDAGSAYMLRVWVKSPGRVVARLGRPRRTQKSSLCAPTWYSPPVSRALSAHVGKVV